MVDLLAFLEVRLLAFLEVCEWLAFGRPAKW